MFIRYFIELSLPVVKVEEALVGSPAGWLSAMAGPGRGDGLLGEVGVEASYPAAAAGSGSVWASRCTIR